MNVQEISIEDQLADVIVRPQPEKRYCAYGDGATCKTLLSQHNKGTMCFRHEVQYGAELAARQEKFRASLVSKPLKRVLPAAVPPATASAAAVPPPATSAAAVPLPAAAAPEFDWMPSLKWNDRKEERTPMTDGMTKADDVRVCAVEGCDTTLANYNKSGRCGHHSYITRGMKLKDGSVPRPLVAEIAAKVAALPTKQKPEKASTEPIAEPEPHDIPAPAPTPEKIALHVPPEALDAFWAKLAIADKARIVEHAIAGAW